MSDAEKLFILFTWLWMLSLGFTIGRRWENRFKTWKEFLDK